MTQMEIHPLGKMIPGVGVTGLDARNLDSATIGQLKSVLAEHGVVVLRDQSLAPAAFACRCNASTSFVRLS